MPARSARLTGDMATEECKEKREKEEDNEKGRGRRRGRRRRKRRTEGNLLFPSSASSLPPPPSHALLVFMFFLSLSLLPLHLPSSPSSPKELIGARRLLDWKLAINFAASIIRFSGKTEPSSGGRDAIGAPIKAVIVARNPNGH